MNITCKYCKDTHHVPITEEDYNQWKKNDGYIQDIADLLSAAQRELLISNTCNICWQRMFGTNYGDKE